MIVFCSEPNKPPEQAIQRNFSEIAESWWNKSKLTTSFNFKIYEAMVKHGKALNSSFTTNTIWKIHKIDNYSQSYY